MNLAASFGGIYKRTRIAQMEQPEPRCVWWASNVNRQGYRWFNNNDIGPNDVSAQCKADYHWHFGPCPPCEGGEHKVNEACIPGDLFYKTCRVCHADLAPNGAAAPKVPLDVGASGSGASPQETGEHVPQGQPDPKPLHQDPRRFRGHIKNCSQWTRVDYAFCSCYVAADPGCTMGRRGLRRDPGSILVKWDEFIALETPFTDRLGDWDL